MYNPYYSYQKISLWDSDQWQGRFSAVCPLAEWIEDHNDKTIRTQAGGGSYAGRTDGTYDSKTKSFIYADTVAEWKEKGLVYHVTEMGGVSWMAMLPEAVASRKDAKAEVLFVLHSADYSDPNWAMNTLEFYRSYNEAAAKAGRVVLYVVPNGTDHSHLFIGILQELAVIYRLEMKRILLDLSVLKQAGTALKEISGFVWKDGNPDECTEQLNGVPVLNIAGRWQNTISQLYETTFADRSKHPAFDVPHHIHSACGRRMAEAMEIEHDYLTANNPELKARWQSMGLRYESHHKDGQQWLSMVPLCCFDEGCEALPVVLIFQETTDVAPYQSSVAMAAFYEYIDLAAQGEMILLYFALETPEDNDLFLDILDTAAEEYPIDLSRVYVTGHSHNGHFAGEFVRRHHERIAAVATLGNYSGLPAPAYTNELVQVTDERVELMSSYDMPLINIAAIGENPFTNCEVGSKAFEDAVDSYQRRLKASRCPQRSFEEIAAARNSDNYISRTLGIPVDHKEIRFLYGCECFIGDVKNLDGKEHLRLVVLGNLCHMCAPQMPELSWDFMRRFARDLNTGEVIERY